MEQPYIKFRMKKIVYLFLVFYLIISCNKVCKRTPFQLSKQTINSKLRLDGYYYSKFDAGTINKNDTIFDILILYNNGIVMSTGSEDSINNLTANIMKNFVLSPNILHKETPNLWGKINIDGSIVRIEESSESFCGNSIRLSEGVILNDTTFSITKYTTRFNKDVKTGVSNSIYHFVHLDQKPDSTNNYIK